MAALPVPDEQAVASFPNPPALFYKVYTDENVSKGIVPKPPPPVKGQYHMFGHPFDIEDAMIRPLEDLGIQRLYPQNYDKKAELKKLNRSILICFLELLDILIGDPASPARNQKIADLEVLFINMHHLINEFRPHQARETLRVIMERQKKQREDVISQVQRATDKACSILKESSESLSQSTSTIPPRLPGERELGNREEEEAMDTGSTTTAVSGSGTQVRSSYLDGAQSLVDVQDAELCRLIDSLISRTGQTSTMPYVLISTQIRLECGPTLCGDEQSDPELMAYLGATLTADAGNKFKVYKTTYIVRKVLDKLARVGYRVVASSGVGQACIWTLYKEDPPQ